MGDEYSEFIPDMIKQQREIARFKEKQKFQRELARNTAMEKHINHAISAIYKTGNGTAFTIKEIAEKRVNRSCTYPDCLYIDDPNLDNAYLRFSSQGARDMAFEHIKNHAQLETVLHVNPSISDFYISTDGRKWLRSHLYNITVTLSSTLEKCLCYRSQRETDQEIVYFRFNSDDERRIALDYIRSYKKPEFVSAPLATPENPCALEAYDTYKFKHTSVESNQGESKMKDMFSGFKSYINEHKDVIYTVGLVMLVDHFFFQGAFQDRLKQLIDGLLKKVEPAKVV